MQKRRESLQTLYVPLFPYPYSVIQEYNMYHQVERALQTVDEETRES